MDAILNKLFDSPKLPLFYKEIKLRLNEESKNRVKFLSELTDDVKAEYINGEPFYHSPVKYMHNDVSGCLYRLLSSFVLKNVLGYVGYEKILISLTRNDYEPDICYFSKRKSQNFTKDLMRFPAPDFIVEILSESTEKNDRGIKFEDYSFHKVKEYWIIDPENEVLEQYILKGDTYELNLKSGSGIVKSKAIKGFEILIRAIFDKVENMNAISKIIETVDKI